MGNAEQSIPSLNPLDSTGVYKCNDWTEVSERSDVRSLQIGLAVHLDLESLSNPAPILVALTSRSSRGRLEPRLLAKRTLR